MLSSHRLPLTSTPVVATRVAELRSTFYWWFPDKRRLIVEHFGVPIELLDVNSRAIAVLIVSKGDLEAPDVVPLVPPKQPYARAAWDFGFTAAKRLPSVARAQGAIVQARAKGNGEAPLVIDKGDFIFIYASEQRANGRVWAPFAWATERGVTAVRIREALKHIAR